MPPTKYQLNPINGFGGEVENVTTTDDGRRTGRWTMDDG